jgi:hypothetical protein
MTTMREWLPVILPIFFGILSILSARWPGHAMRVTRWICQWQLQLLGFQATIQMSDQAIRRCRIFNLCMIPVNIVLLWIGLHAHLTGGS